MEQDVVLLDYAILVKNETTHNVPNTKEKVNSNTPLVSFGYEDGPNEFNHLMIQDFNLLNLMHILKEILFH